MRLLTRFAFFALLALPISSALTGCAEPGSTSGEQSEDHLKKEAKPDAEGTVAGFLLGSYANADAGAGEIAALKLQARTPQTSKRFLGTFTRVEKTPTGERTLEGSFTIQKKSVPSKGSANGKATLPVITFFDAKGAKIDELVAVRVGADIAMSKPGASSEFFLRLEKDAKGNKAVTIDLRCDVTRVTAASPFEEGLEAVGEGDEDAAVVRIEETLGKLEVGLGQMSFSQGEDDITVLRRGPGTNVEVRVAMSSGEKVRLVVESGRGKMFIDDGGKEKDLGEMTCK